eukprot:GSA120T00023250001.1
MRRVCEDEQEHDIAVDKYGLGSEVVLRSKCQKPIHCELTEWYYPKTCTKEKNVDYSKHWKLKRLKNDEVLEHSRGQATTSRGHRRKVQRLEECREICRRSELCDAYAWWRLEAAAEEDQGRCKLLERRDADSPGDFLEMWNADVISGVCSQ